MLSETKYVVSLLYALVCLTIGDNLTMDIRINDVPAHDCSSRAHLIGACRPCSRLAQVLISAER